MRFQRPTEAVVAFKFAPGPAALEMGTDQKGDGGN